MRFVTQIFELKKKSKPAYKRNLLKKKFFMIPSTYSAVHRFLCIQFFEYFQVQELILLCLGWF